MIPKRLDSLFVRLLLAQVLLVACGLLLLGGLLVVERNQLMAPQYAVLIAPQVLIAARTPSMPSTQGLPAYGISEGIRRHESLPEGLKLRVTTMPAIADFVQELHKQGIQVDEVWLGRSEGRFTLWMHVQVPGAEPVWLSGYPPAAFPRWASRMSVGLVLMSLVVGLLSLSLARKVTGPLSQLRRRMQVHAHTGIQAGDASHAPLPRQAPPELLEIDQAYRTLSERLQRNERERALLLAGVSHDLRSPLSRIRLAAEMLPESPANAAGVASITRNVDHADRLTASFVEFIRAGVVELNETVDLAAAARRAVAGFERTQQELFCRAPPTLLLHQAHELLLERLIVNLIDNAIKHGGVPVEVEVLQSGDTAVLTVSDAGPGLPEQGAKQLMEAFARGDASRGLPGFGLGLAIAQQTVVRLQGELVFTQNGSQHQVQARLPLAR
ncbi:hypothetical protein LNV08_06945 [Paucibacter sp. TC2R-5]|uniref:sensor histidine kinase n=1 Tax=Paucibacter sp. TC2R-5 TaxID=2893555 RepID=UPI0021E44D58|nr:ATP-binding protein [Paucibacter sp. TC2R-5]MCV2358712.1 hypothetical protein [Paucibacter sp. TC2R-5]